MNPTQPPPQQLPQTATSGQPTSVNSVLSAMGQNINQLQNVPQQVQQIQGQYNVANDPQVQAMRSAQSDKLKQLFDHDTNLAQTYFPTPQAPGAQPNNPAYTPPSQMVVDPMIGMKAASTQQQATGNEVANISEQIASRKDLLTEGLAKAMQLFQYGLQAKQMEQDAYSTQLTAELTKQANVLKLLGLTGGIVPSDVSGDLGTGAGAYVPSDYQKALSVASVPYTMNPEYQSLSPEVIASLSKIPGLGDIVSSMGSGLTPATYNTIVAPMVSAQLQRQALASTAPTVIKTGSSLANVPLLGGLLQAFGVQPPTEQTVYGLPSNTNVGSGGTQLNNPGSSSTIYMTDGKGKYFNVDPAHYQDALNMGWIKAQ